MNFLKEANKIKTELMKIRRHLHQYPELSNQEYKTSAYIAALLKKWGYKVKTKVGGTGVIGLLEPPSAIRRPRTGCVAIRADMDALPIQEATKKSFSSQSKGIMHACGHDGNMTCALGAAKLLAQRQKELTRPVKIIFQPAEEISNGAERMIKAGALKDPTVEMIIGMHVYTLLPAGKIGLKYGQMMANVDEFTLTITGEGGHGAAPHKGIDAIAVSAEVVTALQQVVSRQSDPTDPVVLTIGTINGGTQYNILADKVVMNGTVRTLNDQTHQEMPKKIEKVVRGITAAFGARYQLEYQVLGIALINDDRIVDTIKKSAAKILGINNILTINRASMGGEDFASYLQKVPGAFFYLGVGNKAKGITHPWHHACFDLDEEALPVGAAVLAQSVWDWHTNV
ncbi:MAG: M20 family metallopeptidase [bacterium]|nr:M20 family metallopeptidase [bacterium]MDD5353777.1 M20 family metallopeptidase [bacterium]MDD5756304.1 M20 family metallopeptidase [bacterium]